MTLSEHQQIFAQQVAQLITFMATQTDYRCTFGEAYRTPEQAALYAKAGKGIVDSLHCERLAIDLNLFSGAELLNGQRTYVTAYNAYEQFGIWWENLDKYNRWGGYFVSKYGGHIVDPNHFERKI